MATKEPRRTEKYFIIKAADFLQKHIFTTSALATLACAEFNLPVNRSAIMNAHNVLRDMPCASKESEGRGPIADEWKITAPPGRICEEKSCPFYYQTNQQTPCFRREKAKLPPFANSK